MSEGKAMGLQLRMEQVLGRRVLFVAGSGDEALLTRAAHAIAGSICTDEFRVVNVDDLLLANVNATRAFLAHLVDGAVGKSLVLSCQRLTGRKLLRLWGGDDLGIFAQTSEAVAYAYRGSSEVGFRVPAADAVAAGQSTRVRPHNVGVSAGST